MSDTNLKNTYFASVRTTGTAILLDVLGAVTLVAANVLPTIQDTVVQAVPLVVQPLVTPLIISLFAGARVWLLKKSQKQQKTEVVNALLTPPPKDPRDVQGLL